LLPHSPCTNHSQLTLVIDNVYVSCAFQSAMQPLSKAKLRLFAALQLKKIRYEERLFIAEGLKMLQEALRSDYEIEAIVLQSGKTLPSDLQAPAHLLLVASSEDFKRLTTQVSPEGVVTVLRIPQAPLCQLGNPVDHLPPGPAFILAAIQDPGNLGTILRTAEWFGMPSIICGPGTVDPFNPKVLRSSMGSLFRTRLYLLDDLEAWLQLHAHLVICADMDGVPLSAAAIQDRPYMLLGNESLGVPASIAKMPGITKVTIPRFGQAESLNAATAAAVLAWELKRGS
jgi:RNA methyltransferase, TrmH family